MYKEKFETLKNEILIELFKLDNKLSDEIINKFNKLIEICTFSLMNSEDNFFAFFLIQMQRKLKLDIDYPMTTTYVSTGFIIYFNPIKIVECSFEEIKALIKHEIYHIMFNHYKRSIQLRKKYSTIVVDNALDIAINQFISNLPPWMPSLENTMLSYNVYLDENKTIEEYCEKLQKAVDKLSKGKTGIHDMWNSEGLSTDEIGELIKNITNNSLGGKIPEPLKDIISAMNAKGEISWKIYLKKFIGTMNSGYKKTITRRDRRQPDRLDLRGKLPNYVPKIAVAIDISASMTDEEIKKIITEILNLVKQNSKEILIIECDSEVRRVYKVKKIEDVKWRIKNNGSTAFSPVFEYIKKKNMRDYVLVYFTDGIGEKALTTKPVNYRTLWVLTGEKSELSLEKSYGVIKNLSVNKEKQENPTYGVDIMREMLNDWAR